MLLLLLLGVRASVTDFPSFVTALSRLAWVRKAPYSLYCMHHRRSPSLTHVFSLCLFFYVFSPSLSPHHLLLVCSSPSAVSPYSLLRCAVAVGNISITFHFEIIIIHSSSFSSFSSSDTDMASDYLSDGAAAAAASRDRESRVWDWACFLFRFSLVF